MNLNNLKKKINLNFKNKNFLIRSLTHKSFDSNNNNEKFKDYLISFYKFCFDLELKDIISGDIKFK